MSVVSGQNLFLHFANIVDFYFLPLLDPMDDVREFLHSQARTFMISDNFVMKEPLPLGTVEFLATLSTEDGGIMGGRLFNQVK